MAQTVFDSPTAVGAKILTVTATVTNTSGAYTNTITDERITTAMKAIEIELGDPSVFGANITVTCNNGSITISCPDVEGTSTVSIDVIKTVDDPTSVTSIEFDVLNSRINKVKEIINDVAEYSDESTYSAGDRVWYSGKLYKANQDIDIAEDWDSTHWDQEDVMDDIDDVRDSIPDIADNLTTNDATKTLSAKQGKVLNDSQAAIQDAIAIVATGDTHAAIESGQFVYVKGHSTLADGLYRASTAIAANESLTSSNLTADANGIANDVLTISQQTLTAAQKSQVKSNLGFANQTDLDTVNSKINQIYIENQYSKVLDVINAYRNTKTFPFCIQKAGSSAYTDLPTGITNTCEWNVICYGTNTRIVAELTIYTGGGNYNKKTYTALIYDGSYINNWSRYGSAEIQGELRTSVTVGANQIGQVLNTVNLKTGNIFSSFAVGSIDDIPDKVTGIIFLWANGSCFVGVDTIAWLDGLVSLRLWNFSSSSATITGIRLLLFGYYN